MDRPVLTRRRLDGIHRGEVIRNDQTGNGALVLRDPHCPVDEVTHLGGINRHLDVLVRNILEQRDQIDLLLVGAAKRRHRLLADDRKDGLVIELRVVEPVKKVHGART